MKKLFLIIALPILFLSACKLDLLNHSYPVSIENRSESAISSYFALGDKGATAYPDTTLSFDSKWVGDSAEPGKTAHRALFTFTFEKWFTEILPQDTLSIFIFSNDTLHKYSWGEVQSGYKILRRYDLGLEDFKKLSDKYGTPIITYPPTDAMKEMKMYPIYGK